MRTGGGTPIIQLFPHLMSIARITFPNVCLQGERLCVATLTGTKGGGLEEEHGALAGAHRMHSDGIWIRPEQDYRQLKWQMQRI